MTQESARKDSTLFNKARTSALGLSWHGLAFAAVLALSVFLNLFRLTSEGYSNSYYAAAVKNMLTSWHNFFFISFDAGFVTVDKPPLGFWIQAASAKLFGFHGWSILLPEGLAAILSVALLYYLVRRSFGPVAGLLAALVLAVTPVAVAVDRTNNPDSLLVLTLLVGAWAVIRAAETGRLRWLLLCALAVGLGFNIKMMQAYLVLPAFFLLYLLASPVSWRRRLVHLGVATIVLVVVSFSWAVAVDMTPADQRPYVGSSSNNSELDLIFGYNGLGRLTGQMLPGGKMSMPEAPPGGGPGGGGENGEPGPLRLLDEQLAGQIGWLLPLALVGLLAASWQNRPRLPIEQQPPQGLPLWRRWFLRVVSFFKNLPQLSLDERQGALVLWGMWLVTMVGFFSVAGMFHRYYLMMLGPGIAALVGAGVVALWRDYRSPGWRGWLLPLTLSGIAALQTYIILGYYDEGWGSWLTLAIVGLCMVAVVGLVALRLKPRLNVGNYSAGAVVVGMLALLIAPTVWAAYTVWHSSAMLPVAGPQTVQGAFGPGGGGPGALRPPGPGATPDPALIDYLQANRGGAKYLVAANGSMSTAPLILNTNEPVIDLGGFGGFDQVLSTDKLSDMIDKGAVRFFLVPDSEGMEEMFSEMMTENPSDNDASGGESGGAPQGPPPGGPPGMDNEAVSWVRDNCEKVPQEEWQSSDSEDAGEPMANEGVLYDCATTGGR